MRGLKGENEEGIVIGGITDEMMDGDSPDNDTVIENEEHEELKKFLSETGAGNTQDLPEEVDPEANREEGPDQDLLHETIDQKDSGESKEELIELETTQSDEKKTKKVESKAGKTKTKKAERVDVGRDLMPEAYSAQNKKIFTLIENWDDVKNAVKTKRLVRAEVTQVNDDDQMITVRFGNIRGIIPYHSSGVEDVGKSLVWLVGRTICFVIESADEKHDGGFFVANRSKGLEALAGEVRKVMKVGARRQAVVSRIESWGVWVELGGVYGRLAKRDLLHSFVDNIADVLNPGELIEVVITKVSDTGRIQVSLKDAIPDPWQKVPYNYKVGSIVSGVITGFIPDLIFIEVEPGVNTVAPYPRFPVNVGQRVAAKIRWIDTEKKRMSSSIWKAV